jgi:hypothetical protein
MSDAFDAFCRSRRDSAVAGVIDSIAARVRGG